VCVCNLIYPARKAHTSYCIVICGLPGSATILHIISLGARLYGKCYWT